MTGTGGPVRLAIPGATSGIGGHVLSWAADARYPVNVLARNPAVVPRQPGVTVTQGGATDPDAVYEAVTSADAVLSARPAARSRRTCSPRPRNVVQAMDKAGARRLIGVSAAGAFIQDDAQAGGLVKLILPRLFARPFADVRAMEQVVRASDLDWTLVRPARLVDEAGRGSWRVRDQYPPPGLSKIARAGVAQFVIAALTESRCHHQARAICW